MPGFLRPLALILFAGSALAQPVVNAVLNSASNTLPDLPGSSIAQGSIFVAYGTDLGPAEIVHATAFPLPRTLGGTSVQVTVNNVTVDAIMIYSLDKQIAAILPSSTPAGTGTLTVTYKGQTSGQMPVTVVASSFGTYSLDETGTGPAVATFADGSVIGPMHPAHPDDTVVLWGTGLGPTQADEAAGPAPADMTNLPIEVYVGGEVTSLLYRGRSGCCAGLDQVVVRVPGSAQGCKVSVAVAIGSEVSNFTTVAVAPANATECTDSQDPGEGLGRKGFVSLSRNIGAPVRYPDGGYASFSNQVQAPGAAPPRYDSASFGSCTVYKSSSTLSLPYTTVSLDAGPTITITGPHGTRSLTKSSPAPQYFDYEGDLGDGTLANYLDPGVYTATGPGGADVGPFSATLTLPQPVVWTNQSSIVNITRANGLVITWTGGDPSQLIGVSGYSGVVRKDGLGRFISSSAANFDCFGHASDGNLTVPPVVLLSLPPTPPGADQGTSFLDVTTSVSESSPFTATGLDYAYFIAGSILETSVAYH